MLFCKRLNLTHLKRPHRADINSYLRKSSIIGENSFARGISIKLADIGEGIHEVELLKWFVNEGDKVKIFDRLCEVQSDKATVEITSRYNGVIKSLRHKEGSIVKVGDTLVDLGEHVDVDGHIAALSHMVSNNFDIASYTTTSPPSFDTNTCVSNSSALNEAPKANGKKLASPVVRKIALDNGIDLANVIGSGPEGQILKTDIEKLLKKHDNISKQESIIPSPPADKNVISSKRDLSSNLNWKTACLNKTLSQEQNSHIVSNTNNQVIDKVVPIRGIQRVMVNSMTAALQVQHLTLCDEVNMSSLVQLRDQLQSICEIEKRNIKLRHLPILIKIVSLSLSQFPMLNATVNQGCTEMVYHAHHNIGVAMDTKMGLVVPVIEKVETKSIIEIATELDGLQKSTLKESHFKGGTFSLSNIGSIGGTYAVPVVNVPQVAIGAFGQIQYLPRYVKDNNETISNRDFQKGNLNGISLRPVPVMNVSWSADHRVVDGATIARFSNVFKSYVQNPSTMIMYLK